MVGSDGKSGYLLGLYSYHLEKKHFFIIAMLAEASWRERWLNGGASPDSLLGLPL